MFWAFLYYVVFLEKKTDTVNVDDRKLYHYIVSGRKYTFIA